MNKSKLGMTFVEVIIAMAIFAILVVAIFPAFLIGIKLNAVARVSVETSTKAQEILEEIYYDSTIISYTETENNIASLYTPQAPDGSTKNFFGSSDGYDIHISITPDTTYSTMYRIIVNVTKIDNPYNAQPAQAETILLFE